MKLWDSFKRKVLRRGVEELAEAAEEQQFIPNRAMRRYAAFSQRRRGSGYTRAMRKGRRVERERPS